MADLVQRVDGGGETTVHAEHLVVDDGRQTQIVEDLRAIPPHIDRSVLAQALVVKAIHLRNLAGLVVASDQGYSIGVSHFKSQQQQKSLNAVVASVHKITHEQVVGVGALATYFEQLNQIIKLSVDISANLKRPIKQ